MIYIQPFIFFLGQWQKFFLTTVIFTPYNKHIEVLQPIAKYKKGWNMYKDYEKKTLSDLLGDKLITAPTVFECISARTVELCGYPAMVLSGTGMSYCMNGMPDLGLINDEEVIYLTTRLTNYTPLPVIVDAGAFYGDDPVKVYHICSRLVKAGADAIVITDAKQDDGKDRKFDASFINETVPDSVYFSRIKAAVAATENTKCLVIAKSIDSLEIAVKKTIKARDLGATITCVADAHSKKDAEFVSNADSGLKMWAGIDVVDNKCVVEPDELEKLGFNIVVEDYSIKAAMFGMLYYGHKTLEDGNTVFHDTHTYDGLLQPGEDYHVLFSFWKTWLPMEDEFNDLSDVMAIEHEIKGV